MRKAFTNLFLNLLLFLSLYIEYGRNRRQKLSEENKQRRREYQKKYGEVKNQHKKLLSFFSSHSIKMEQKVLIFGDQCINKNVLLKNGKPINTDKVETKRIVLSSEPSYDNKGSFKYFIGYIHNGNAFPVPLCIKLPQMNGYVKHFDNNNKYINLLVHDEELLKNTMKYGKKLKTYLKESLIVNQCIMINALKLK